MGLGSLIRRRIAPEFVLDPAYGHDVASHARADLAAGRWDQVDLALKDAPDATTRWFLVRALSRWDDRPDFVERWSVAEPNNAFAWMVRGAHSLDWAWQARGTSKAEFVDDWRWDRFNERLEHAFEELRQARAIAPDDPTSPAFLLRCALGMHWAEDQATECLLDVLRSSSDHLGALHSYLTFVCAKWQGSHGRMFDFARGIVREAPDGDERHGLIAQAHIERWLYADAFKQDTHADEYWLERDVQGEILEAYERSIVSPQHRPGVMTIETCHIFLFCFTSMSRGLSERDRMRALVDRIGPIAVETPWRYLGGDPVRTYANIWKCVR